MSVTREENEETPPSDIILFSKSKLSSDLFLHSCDVTGAPIRMIGVDFTLDFWESSAGSSGRWSVRCHKFILASRSTFFRDILVVNRVQVMENFKIEFESLTEAAIFNMIQYIYCGTISEVPKSASSAIAHLHLAKTFNLELLERLVLNKLRESLQVSDCFELLAKSIQNPMLSELKEIAIQILVENLSNLSQEEIGKLSRTQHSAMVVRRYFNKTDEESNGGPENKEDSCSASTMKLSSDLEKSLKIKVRCNSGSLDVISDTHRRADDGNIVLGADFALNVSGRVIHCHKFMLAARSKVFRDMLFGEFNHQDPKLDSFEIDYHHKAAVHNMIEFIYTGTIDDVPIDTVSDHLRLAKTFKLEPMEQLVERKLTDEISTSNALKLLNLALKEPLLPGLKEKVFDTIVNNLSTVTSLEEWENFSSDQPCMTEKILCTYFMSS